jgi:hypothetical protein
VLVKKDVVIKRKYLLKIKGMAIKEERQEFIENIQKWVSIDTQIKTANEKIKGARELKSKLGCQIYEYAEKNALNETIIEISDGDLRFYEKREYQPISFGYVEDCLEKLLADPKQVEKIMDYLHENREVKVSKDIRRTYKQK